MFRWYKRSGICYAFLSDVEVNSLEHTAPRGFHQIEEETLARAKWFTRGWTLQELIAPKNIKFFVKKWKLIGTKATLLEKLSRITGIDPPMLEGWPLGNCSIARCMTWAAKRTTTRVEDSAYSLLGIFDMNMSLIYGEGEKAFSRLQEEILKESEDQSLFAWSPQPSIQVNRIPVVLNSQAGGISIFARHPSEFVISSHVEPMGSRCEPPTITSRGVKMETPILRCPAKPWAKPWEVPMFYMVLSCTVGGRQDHHPVVPLRERDEDSSTHTYVRNGSASVLAILREDIARKDKRHIMLRKTVFRQDVRARHNILEGLSFIPVSERQYEPLPEVRIVGREIFPDI